MEQHDVIIVGAGPAGIFAALELSQCGGLDVIILDKGSDIDERYCPKAQLISGICQRCRPCVRLSGWGGAGAYSDGKLTLSPNVGGHLQEIRGMEETGALVEYVDSTYTTFGAPTLVYGTNLEKVERIAGEAVLAGMRLKHFPVRHMGTDGLGGILRGIRDDLVKRGVTTAMRREVTHILTEDSRAIGVVTNAGEIINGRYVVIAPGREGTAWLLQVAEDLGLSLQRNPVDLGVRVELPATVLQPLTDVLYEPHLYYYSKAFDDEVRTFCVCPFGEVIAEWAGDVMTVNGHSYANRKTTNTNFALLVRKTFTEPFKDPIAYGKYIARLANLLSGGVIVQRLGDLDRGRRTNEQRLRRCTVMPTLKDAVPGDLGLVLPYRYLINIMEVLKAMDKLAPGVFSHHTLIYGVEVKFYSSRPKLSACLETEVQNLFAAGDGAGITRGLMQASASGVVVAREILSRLHG
jgi:uncharacterized FAD-dependent dehydrogenase